MEERDISVFLSFQRPQRGGKYRVFNLLHCIELLSEPGITLFASPYRRLY